MEVSIARSRGASTSESGRDAPGAASLDRTARGEARSTIHDYEKLGRVGEGTYGVVYRGREKSTGRIVALKKVRMDKEKDGVPVTAVREMGILMRCRSHPNIVNLLKVVQGKHNAIFLVFEYCEHDIGKLMQTMRFPFAVPEVKTLTIQLLSAVSFLHEMHVFHRDLKMSNLLLNNRGELKLCDLGLARQFAPRGSAEDGAYTAKVVTLWYRAPELLLGLRRYGPAVDMWATASSPSFCGTNQSSRVRRKRTPSRRFAELGAPHAGIRPGGPLCLSPQRSRSRTSRTTSASRSRRSARAPIFSRSSSPTIPRNASTAARARTAFGARLGPAAGPSGTCRRSVACTSPRDDSDEITRRRCGTRDGRGLEPGGRAEKRGRDEDPRKRAKR